ncbi:MAG TPA: tetratricopeptide repeat protein [Bryobacteraceae bacterium]|nr:tetratricopeptide repeat protein [Bryobacteraceae bacterium]
MAASTFGCGHSAKHYLDQGNQLFSAGKYDDASLNYRNALKKDPKSGEAYYRLALAQLKLGKLPDAYQALNRAVELSPQNAPAKVELAAISLTAYTRDPRHPAALYNRAVALSNELLALNPKSADGLRLKGEIAIVDKRYKEAMEAFRQAQQSSGAPENQFELAEAMLLDNQPEEAERQAKAAIAQYPTFTPTYDLLYALLLKQQRWAEAESLLKQRIASNPKDAAGVVRLAAFYLGRKQPEDAEKTLDSGLLGHRDVFPQADLLAGDFHALAGNWDQALADYQRGASRDASRYQAYQERIAMALATLGRRDEALKTIDTVLTKDPKDTPVRALKVSVLTAKGGAENVKTAANLAAELAKEFPGRLQIQMLAAQAAAANGDLDAATARLQQAAKIDQKFLPARLALARIYLLRRNYPAMLEQANAALSIKSDDDNARLLHIIALTGTKSFAQAKNEAEQLSRSSSNRRQAEMQLGVIALSQQHYAEAEAHFQKLYREGGDDLQPLAGLVSAYMGEHMPDRALQLLEGAKKRAPGSVGTEALLAATAQATGNLGLALSQMQDIASQTPNSAAVQLRIADLERKQGNLPAALAALERARQLQPGAKGVDAAIASVQDELGRKAEAVASYRKALAQLPDDPAVLNNLAYLLAETGGDLNEALRLVSAGLRKAPDNPALQDTLAWIDIQKGQTAAALPIFSSLIRKNPSDVTFRYHYAVALLRSGDAERARQQAEVALSNKPSPAMQDQIRKLLAQLR